MLPSCSVEHSILGDIEDQKRHRKSKEGVENQRKALKIKRRGVMRNHQKAQDGRTWERDKESVGTIACETS